MDEFVLRRKQSILAASRGIMGRLVRGLLFSGALAFVCMAGPNAFAQQAPPPSTQQPSDEQIANDINAKLTASSSLHPLNLGVWVHDGTVTLRGTVPNQETLQQAEELVQSVDGVRAVDDKLTVQSAGNTANGQAGQSGSPQTGPPPPGPPPPPPTAEQLQQNYGGPSPAESPEQSSEQGQQPYPEPPPPYNAPMPPTAGSQQPANQPMVTLPAGTYLYVMMLQTVDSKHSKPGSPFRAVVMQDVMLQNGAVAIPRGAFVEGAIVDARPPGHLKGRPKLALQLSHLDMGNMGYPMTSGFWSTEGPGKGGQTAATVTGTTAMGAITGGIVGGGPTALLGAAIGGLGGLGISALSPGARLLIPAESVLTFRLGAPLTLREPTPQEMRALSGNVPPPRYGYGAPPPYPYPGYPPPPPPPPGGYPY